MMPELEQKLEKVWRSCRPTAESILGQLRREQNQLVTRIYQTDYLKSLESDLKSADTSRAIDAASTILEIAGYHA